MANTGPGPQFQEGLTTFHNATTATYPTYSFVSATDVSITNDIDNIVTIKINIDNQEKITTSTQEKQDDSDQSHDEANDAVAEANEAINEAIIMLQFLCGGDTSLPHMKTEILTEKLTTPPRVYSNMRSNRRGEYPTILRTGDIDRRGTFRVSFDDLNTVKFNRYQDISPGDLSYDFTYNAGTSEFTNSYDYDKSNKLLVHVPLSSNDTYLNTNMVTPGKRLHAISPTHAITPTSDETSIHGRLRAKVGFGVYTSQESPFDQLHGKAQSLHLDKTYSRINIGSAYGWNKLIGSNRATFDVTLSIWVKPEDYGPVCFNDDEPDPRSQFARIFEFGNFDIALFPLVSGKLFFRWFNASNPLGHYTSTEILQLNTWSHIAITFNVDTGTEPTIYINGNECSLSVGLAPANTLKIHGNDCLIGNRKAGDRRFKGHISNFAVWDTILDADDIKAIYLNGCKWTSNLNNTVHYSQMLEENDAKLMPLTIAYDTHDGPASPPKRHNSDIIAQGRVLKGIGDETFDIYTPGEDISAFTDNLNVLTDAAFYMTGTAEDIYPGFTSPLKSKTSFMVDITPAESHILARCPQTFLDMDVDADPHARHGTTGPHSGFAYFTICDRIWEDVGVIDYTTEAAFVPEHEIVVRNMGPDTLYTGLVHNPVQFIPANNLRVSHDVDIEQYSDAKFFASPTMSHDAPNNVRYFAKQAQEITLPISSPFLLEKITLNVPVIYSNTYDKRNMHSCTKTIDSLTFFLYHQRSNVGHEISSLIDSEKYKEVASGSIRTLIASGSAAFWQRNISWSPDTTSEYSTISGAPSSVERTIELYHSPSFEYDWSATNPQVREPGQTDVVEFHEEVDVKIEMIPAISQNAFKSRNKYPAAQTLAAGGLSTGPAIKLKSFYHKWFAGVREKGHDEEDCFVYSDKSGGGCLRESRYDSVPAMKAQFPNRFVKSKTGAGNSEPVRISWKKYDPTTTAFVEQLSPSSKTSKETSTIAPYVLLPGDSLVLGVEYSPSMPWQNEEEGHPDSANGDYHCAYISSSYVTIKDEKASMTMYGSLISENKEYHETRNQDLTSFSIHEAMNSDPVLDQFEIEPGLLYSGSMLNEYVSGNMFNTNETSAFRRYVRNNASLDDDVTEWSLLRGVRTIDENERFYDTLLPSMEQLFAELGLRKVSDLDPTDDSELITSLSGIPSGAHKVALYANEESYSSATTNDLLVDLDGNGTLEYDLDGQKLRTWQLWNAKQTQVPGEGLLVVYVHTFVVFGDFAVVTDGPNYTKTDPYASQLWVHPDYEEVYHPNKFDLVEYPLGYTDQNASWVKYNYHVNFMTSSLALYPFSIDNSTKRSEWSTGGSLLTRHASVYWDNNYNSIEDSDNPELVTEPVDGNGDPTEAMRHFYRAAFDTLGGTEYFDALKIGPKVSTISGQELKKFMFMGGVSTLISEDKDKRGSGGSFEFEMIQRGGPKFYFGFNPEIPYNDDAVNYFSYGVRNISPIKTSAVFRHQHYGQFRDMLEQRTYSRFYKKAGKRTDQSRFKFAMLPHQTYVSRGPVSVKFVEPNTEIRNDPLSTESSSNVDNHATSSMPFIDDGMPHNRSYDLDSVE